MFTAILAGAKATAPFVGQAAIASGTAITAAVVAKKASGIVEKKVLETVEDLNLAKDAAVLGYQEARENDNVDTEPKVAKKTA